LFLVEIEFGLAPPLGPIGGFPRFERSGGCAGGRGLELLQLTLFAREHFGEARLKFFDEGQRARAAFGHAAVQYQFGKLRSAQQPRFRLAQGENFWNEDGVVLRRGAADVHARLPDCAAQRVVLGVFHERDVGRSVERETPAGRERAGIFLEETLPGGGARAFGQTGQARLVGNGQFPGIGGIEDVLGKFLGGGGNFGIEALEFRFIGGRQTRAGIAEVCKRLFEKTAADAGEGAGIGRRGVGLKDFPQALIEVDARVKVRHLRQHGVVGGAQRGRVGDGVKVLHPRPGTVERGGGLVKRAEYARVGKARGILRGDDGKFRLGIGERSGNVRLDAVGGEAAPGRGERGGKEGHGKSRRQEVGSGR
jgi:hypothetical protein